MPDAEDQTPTSNAPEDQSSSSNSVSRRKLLVAVVTSSHLRGAYPA